MPTTPGGIPYPAPTDKLNQWPSIAQAMAEAVEAHSGFVYAIGTVNITLSNSTSGAATIAFPAGRFSVAPLIFLTREEPALVRTIPSVSARSATGATIRLYDGGQMVADGTAAVAWLAIGVG